MDAKEIVDYVLQHAERLRKAGVLHVRVGDAELWLSEDVSQQLAYFEQLAGTPQGLPKRPSERDIIHDPDTGSRGFARRPKRINHDEQE